MIELAEGVVVLEEDLLLNGVRLERRGLAMGFKEHAQAGLGIANLCLLRHLVDVLQLQTLEEPRRLL